ncbi:MAG: VWA domain-containing protein [Solirubrobacteraceae bacterium]
MSAVFPLSAIVGQEQLIEALLINAVAPDVGGVLVRGERGTAKTTAVRGLASLLPAASADGSAGGLAAGLAGGSADDLPGGTADRACAPLVELPLGTTLDRLVGSLDLKRALDGEHRFEAGLLSRAHQGILYVDEVNLLADHLVDALLDAAATGVARVEREAVSVTHEARFLLVGTMNPEEGELRPQLLDRFGLGVEVRTPGDPVERAEIVRRRLAFEADPEAFLENWRGQEEALAARIVAARAMIERVVLPERELLRITGACAQLRVDGVRGDIVTARAARALAALEGVSEVSEAHVRRAAVLALAHRRRRDPLAGRLPDDDDVQRALDDLPPEIPDDEPPGPRANEPPESHGNKPPRSRGNEPPASQSNEPPGPDGHERSDHHEWSDGRERSDGNERSSDLPRAADGIAPERVASPMQAHLPSQALKLPGVGRGPAGRRARGSGAGAGAIDSREAAPDSDDVAVVATLRARLLGADHEHLREHVRAGREGAFLCLVVDASGSMGARRRSARVKGALLELLRDAYARRDRVAVIAFRDSVAEVMVAPGAPIEQAATALRALPTGGRTPLAAGLRAAEQLIARERARERSRRSVAVLLTDGRVTEAAGQVLGAAVALGRAADAVEVIDTEDGPARVGIAGEIAAAAGGRIHRLVTTTRRAA